jgi:hypothetical protein
MKKTYIQPATEKIEAEVIQMLCGSLDKGRFAAGDPTVTDGKKLPAFIGETAEGIDPFCGHGQGIGGAGNRSNEALWEDEI